ncbi:MAG: acyl-CoA synthetase [Rhodospirillales bacterium]|nr:acyl-CoA synthetase [Rhodospirillales bacterium]MDP6643372.1 acyl-CoA synthetase [Rhodospirillales bacterium]
MSEQRPIIRNLKEVEEFEAVPLAERMRADTVYELINMGAAHDPERAVIHYLLKADPDETPQTLSYGAYLTKVRQAANLFHRLLAGEGKEDGVIGVLLPMVPENYITLAAGPTAGILCPVNWALSAEAIANVMKAAKVRVLVALGPCPEFGIWESAQKVAELVPSIEHLIQVQGPGGVQDSEIDFNALIDAEPGDALTFERAVDAETTAIYCPTGGTTGAPKLARLAHGGIAYKCHVYSWYLGHGPGDVVFAGTPLFHSGGIVNRSISPMSQGMTNVILSPHGFREKNTYKNYWKLVEKYRATELIAVPTALSALLSQPVDGDISSLGHYSNTGSAGLPAAVGRAVEEKFGVRMLSNYGLTENTASAAIPPRHGEPRYGSSGIRLPYTQIKAVKVDAGGKYEGDCPDGEVGVIAIKGPGVVEGYVDETLNRDLFFPDGWLNTGDLGRFDEDGFIWITGRLKDLIIRGGNNIDSRVIDETLQDHEAVELAAAVGKPDTYAGELPIAYVQLKPGAQATSEDIRLYAREHIPERGAAPAEIHIIEKMPLTEVGKIFKPPLRRDAAEKAFAEALAPLSMLGAGVDIAVADDATRGTLATIRLTGDVDDAAVSQAEEIMAAYTMSHKIVRAR